MSKREPKYDIVATYNGYNLDLDAALERAARTKRVGSGYNFFDSGRDVVFSVDRKSTAINVQKRLRKAIKKAKVRGRVEAYEVATGEVKRLY